MAKYELVSSTPALSLTLYHVTAETLSNDRRTEVLDLINRGRQVQLGNRLGHSGTITCQIQNRVEATATAQKAALDALWDSSSTYTLTNPWGVVRDIVITNISETRVAGTGENEVSILTITYVETL